MIDTVNMMHLDSVLSKIQTNLKCLKHENNYCVLVLEGFLKYKRMAPSFLEYFFQFRGTNIFVLWKLGK